ncbi:hypothetical protein WA026_021779 [Henosepilachna vigintioctopunctata]|uniref:Zinc finger PHD-type domain-containing protein n=1 Tax=Henosepilachna vigintioctopunctata TaxID=420089 RepID=A0AAW1TZH9_9CUCU
MATSGSKGLENTQKVCKHCKKKVIYALDCVHCSTSYHPSCANQAKLIIDKDKLICCEAHDKSEVKPEQNWKLLQEMDEKKLKNVVREVLREFLDAFKKDIETKMNNIEASVQYMSDYFEEYKKKSDQMMEEQMMPRASRLQSGPCYQGFWGSNT